MTFSEALNLIKQGKEVYRTGWHGKGATIMLQEVSDEETPTLPYIIFCTAESQWVPWVASQTDLLANDWEEKNYALR